METAVTVRSAGVEDVDIIQSLAHKIWPDTYADILAADQIAYMMQLIYSIASLKKQMEEQQHRFLIAELNNEPVGFASYSSTTAPGIFKLHKIYVRADIQGKGLGKALIDKVITAIKPSNATALLLNVNRHNKAKTFYEKFGFKVIKEEDIDIGNGYFMNDYVMQYLV